MSHESIKTALSDAVNQTAANIPFYAVHPDKDFTRIRKISAADLISFLVSYSSSSTRLELLDFFGMVPNAPSASAFNQQRAKLKPDTLEAVFHQFNSSVLAMEKKLDYLFIAADGSTFTFFSKPSFSMPEYFVSEGHSMKGF